MNDFPKHWYQWEGKHMEEELLMKKIHEENIKSIMEKLKNLQNNPYEKQFIDLAN
jgi:uncharacterized protein involved in tolerance to divalent cations